MIRPHKESSLAFIFICIVISISLFQLIVYITRSPQGFFYPLVHNYVPDYYWYLSLMRQGWEGKIAVTTLYTPEFFVPKLVNSFFPLLGLVARASGLSLPVAYTFARIIGGILVLWASYILARKLFSTNRLLTWVAFVFVTIGTPFWYLSNGQLHQVGEFWTGFDPMLRVTFLPHHLFANALYITVLILLTKSIEKKDMRLAVFAGVCIVIAGFMNPAVLIAFSLTLLVAIVVRHTLFYGAWHVVSIVFVLAAMSVLFLWSLQQSTFPWTAFASWERFVFYPITSMSFMGVLGFTGICALVGLFVQLRTKNLLWLFVISWFVAPFIGLEILSKFLPLSNGRYFQTAAYIPAAMLAAQGVGWIVQKVEKSFGLGLLVWVSAVVAVVFFSLPSFVASANRQLFYVNQNMSNSLVYVPVFVQKPFNWIEKNTTRGTVIAAPEEISTLIPAFTGRRTLVGHPTFTYEPDTKQLALAAIYASLDQKAIAANKVDVVWVPASVRSTLIGKNDMFVVGYEDSHVILLVRKK